jgi:hypothetical protein
MVFSERRVGDVPPTAETRYCISSVDLKVKALAEALRSHWGIENELHSQLDVTFGEDRSRVQKRDGAVNRALLRRLTLALLKAHPSKGSLARRRFAAAPATAFLAEVLNAGGTVEKP